MITFFRYLLTVFLLVSFFAPAQSRGFELAKYGSDFLSTGGGARPLGMGSAYTAITRDVLSGYWNPAGLSGIDNWQFVYMHSERFAGVVGYDYGALAMSVDNSGGVLALSFFRQGVDGIKNTLHAWDPEQNRPRSNPEQHITEFSATDLAFFLSYAQKINPVWHWGVSAKVLRSRLGPFASAWGYSLDAGIQRRGERYQFGVNVMDLTTMLKYWTVNEKEWEGLKNFTNPLTEQSEEIPSGANEVVLPRIKIGVGRVVDIGNVILTLATDADILMEGRKTYYLNVGRIHIEPHLGAELAYQDLLFLRTGITDIHLDDRQNVFVSPTLGAGLRVGAFMVDYGFNSFAGIASDLGFTHRISLQLHL